MSGTLAGMKTEQVRIPVELAEDARVVSAALGKTLTEYVREQLRQSVNRDWPKITKIIVKRGERTASEGTEGISDR